MIRLNIGSGGNKINGFINIDPYSEVSDSKHDFLKDGPYLYKSGSVDDIIMFHCIEHIEKRYHPALLQEFYRLLKVNGSLILSYPEFTKVAKNYIENVNGQRDFWEATIYGRQKGPGDYHVSLMDSTMFQATLEQNGFTTVAFVPEYNQPFNTACYCWKGKLPVTYEEIIVRDMVALTLK